MKKRRYKIKKKNVYIFLIVLVGLFFMLFGKCIFSVTKLMFKDYSLSDSFTIYNSGYWKKVLEKEYNSDIVKIIDKDDFLEKNFDLYYEIDYIDEDYFLSFVNSLISMGYSTDDINVINKKNDVVLNEYLKNNYVSHIDRWIKYDFFKSEYIERYLKFFDGDYKQTIVNVNIGLDKEFYKDANVITEYSVNVLANKYNKLDSSYVPANLTPLNNCSGGGHYLAIEAKEAYDKMCIDANNNGFDISVNSSYRSYESQEEIYQYYLKIYGQSYVDNYVAVPGFSEHQTGLALDIKSNKVSIFKNSNEYKWMLENSYKYGFILRYPEGKSDITGYTNEAWHYRYVGVEAAKYIYENNITYDEYYVMFLDK